jgi:hypothetical protein
MARQEGIPPRLLPILYFATAHLALAAAAFDPGDLAGFFYHPRLVTIVQNPGNHPEQAPQPHAFPLRFTRQKLVDFACRSTPQ